MVKDRLLVEFDNAVRNTHIRVSQQMVNIAHDRMKFGLLHNQDADPTMSSVFKVSRYEQRRLRKLAKLCHGATVLDVGCARLPNPYFQGMHRVGFDLELPSVATDYEEHIEGDALEMSRFLGDRTFDNIVAGEFIEHLENPYQFLRTARRHLADGGRIIVSTPNPISFPCLAFELISSKRRFYSPNHTYYFCPRWVEQMLRKCGFNVDRVQGVGLWTPGLVIPCPATISYQVIYVGSVSSATEIDQRSGETSGV